MAEASKKLHPYQRDLQAQIFHRFSDDEWSRIVKACGLTAIEAFRSRIEKSLSDYQVVPVMGLEELGYIELAEDTDGRIFRHDLEIEHRRQARDMRAAADWLETRPSLSSPMSAETRTEIVSKLRAVANYSDVEAIQIRRLKHPLNREEKAGNRKPDYDKRELVDALISIWRDAGGKVPRSGSAKGGPLVRFLGLTVAKVDKVKKNAPRGWIRDPARRAAK